ncbi:MAG TPA: SRPBCC domain-containing protein [Blastocatellia bacterium]|nr:SRPBCC domain-containing protein [Blastocatellia bacterium]
MAKSKPATKPAGISDNAVKAATGRSWAEWFAILNKAGAKKMSHKAIAQYLHDELNCPPWWSQMVTVGYEQKSGRRETHQKPEGYQVSVSRTLNTTAASLDKAWQNSRTRDRWLAEPIEIRRSTAKKSLRITWKDKKTSVDVNFYPKGDGKCQVTVQHSKLKDSRAATRMKAFWADALDRLRSVLKA